MTLQFTAAPALAQVRDVPGADAAIEKGLAQLLKHQAADGTWKGPEASHCRGMTALALYTLLKCGLSAEHPAVAPAATWLRAQEFNRTYDLGVGLQALQALHDPKDIPKIKSVAQRLVRTVSNGAPRTNMAWGYPFDHSGDDMLWTDLSNTQYALLGLRAAKLAGVNVGSVDFWKSIALDLMDIQEVYGGFGYRKGQKASASMTVAGMTCLCICNEMLGEKFDANFRRRVQGKVDLGIKWLDDHWSVEHNFDYRFEVPHNDRWRWYYLYGLERVGAFTGKDLFGSRDWYGEGGNNLVKTQGAEGNWGYGDEDTCFALLFLRRGSRTTAPPPRPKPSVNASAGGFDIGTSSDAPLTAWIRGLDKELSAQLASGAKPVSLTWWVDGEAVKEIPLTPESKIDSNETTLRHDTRRNGVFKVRAQLRMVGGDGADRIADSPEASCRLDDVAEPWSREALADFGKNLVATVGATITASSSHPSYPAAWITDGRWSTHWLVADKQQNDAWIQIDLKRPVQATCIKFGVAVNPNNDLPEWETPRDVEVRLGSDTKFIVRVDESKRAKQRIVFPARSVKSIRLKVLSRNDHCIYPTLGFNEIEVFAVPPDDPDVAELMTPGAILVKRAAEGGEKWLYSVSPQPKGWQVEGSDRTGWIEGEAAFASNAPTPFQNAPSKTDFSASTLYLVKEFNVPKGVDSLSLDILHDDFVEVWLNGVPAAYGDWYTKSHYRVVNLPKPARAALRPGKNLLAVRLRNNPGGQGYFDLSVTALAKADMR